MKKEMSYEAVRKIASIVAKYEASCSDKVPSTYNGMIKALENAGFTKDDLWEACGHDIDLLLTVQKLLYADMNDSYATLDKLEAERQDVIRNFVAQLNQLR